MGEVPSRGNGRGAPRASTRREKPPSSGYTIVWWFLPASSFLGAVRITSARGTRDCASRARLSVAWGARQRERGLGGCGMFMFGRKSSWPGKGKALFAGRGRPGAGILKGASGQDDSFPGARSSLKIGGPLLGHLCIVPGMPRGHATQRSGTDQNYPCLGGCTTNSFGDSSLT